MNETTFNPPTRLRARAETTEKRDGRWMTGEVHDPRAHLLGGVAGHAGLFSTMHDLVTFGRMLLGEGELNGTQVLLPETVRTMRERHPVSNGYRTLGWDSQSSFSTNRGEALSDEAFGHGGFTGTVFWIDPQKDLIFVFLGNRLHPDGDGSVNALAGDVLTLVASRNPADAP